MSDIFPKVGELVGTGSPIMSISLMNDLWGTFNVREDQLNGMTVGSTITAFVPAFKKEVRMKVYYIKDQEHTPCGKRQSRTDSTTSRLSK